MSPKESIYYFHILGSITERMKSPLDLSRLEQAVKGDYDEGLVAAHKGRSFISWLLAVEEGLAKCVESVPSSLLHSLRLRFLRAAAAAPKRNELTSESYGEFLVVALKDILFNASLSEEFCQKAYLAALKLSCDEEPAVRKELEVMWKKSGHARYFFGKIDF